MDKPAIPNLRIPDDLAELDQWVLWRYEIRDQKKTKIPYTVRGYRASSTNPKDWAPLEDVLAAWRRQAGTYSGIGFVFSRSDPFAGIDLDESLENGEPKTWARGIIERFSDTYMEISPSGRGLKIWVRGSLPENVPGAKLKDDRGGVEVYDSGRYFTVTGRVFRGAPLQIEDHAIDLLALYAGMRPDTRKGTWPVQPKSNGRIPYGQQHNTLVSIAGTLRARRVCDPAIEACLLAIAEHQCERPMEPEHIARIVRSTRRWAGQ
jgi:hypothetical protein